MKYCINKECEDILGNPDYYYCPWCGTKQTSALESGRPNTLAASSEFAQSAPSCGESGVNVHVAQLVERPAENGKAVGAIPAVDTFKPFRAWVAWHPDPYKVWDIALSRGSCEVRITSCRQGDFATYEEFVACHESELNTLRNDGWIIQQVEVKPVEGE